MRSIPSSSHSFGFRTEISSRMTATSPTLEPWSWTVLSFVLRGVFGLHYELGVIFLNCYLESFSGPIFTMSSFFLLFVSDYPQDVELKHYIYICPISILRIHDLGTLLLVTLLCKYGALFAYSYISFNSVSKCWNVVSEPDWWHRLS